MNITLSAPDTGKMVYAGVFARLAAYLIDCLILFVALLAWQAALYFVNPIASIIQSGGQPTGIQIHLWVFATATIPFLFYFTLMLRSVRQATFGMRFLKLKVVDADSGERIAFFQALLRSAVMLIPFELNHALMFHLFPRDSTPPSTTYWIFYAGVWAVIIIYLVTIKITRKHQSIHDFVSGTVCVSGASRSDLSY